MKIAMVTDSTCDIPFELVDQYNIYVVPNILVIDGKSIEDNRDFSRQEFYAHLPQMSIFPTTATASSGTYHGLYARLLNQGIDFIFSIHASRFLSGIYNAANLAAQAFAGQVQVIDSQQVTLGLGFQVLAAAEAAAEGQALEAISARLEDVRRRVRVVAMLDTLEYVRRSGRVSWARASLGSLLHIKTFVEVKDGVVYRLGETRTRSKGINRLIEIMQGMGPLERLALLHTNAEAEARQMLEQMAPRVATLPLLVNITTVIGTHVGPHGLGFASLTA